MTIPEILEALATPGRVYPLQAMQAAIEQREAITPELLRDLEEVANDPARFAPQTERMTHIFALYLLAQFREKRACPLLLKIASLPGQLPFDLLGDTVSDGLNQAIASVYDGNLEPIHSIIENESLDEFVRGSALDTLAILGKAGILPRDALFTYLRSLFHGKLQRTPNYVWCALVTMAVSFFETGLMTEVEQAFSDDLVDPMYDDLEGLQKHSKRPEPDRMKLVHNLITDAISETNWWAVFRPEKDSPRPSSQLDLGADYQDHLPPLPGISEPFTPQPLVLPPKIGRNDPCPCGSGKKFKKCCIDL